MKSPIRGMLATAALVPALVPVLALGAAPEPVGLVKAAGVATFGQLDELRSQNAMLAEAAKAAELRSKLGVGGAAAAPRSTGLAPAAAPRAPDARQADAVPASTVASSAQVDMVSGVGNALIAHITLQNGNTVAARVGTSIPGIGVVRSISIHEVVVASKKRVLTIPFAVEPAAAGPGMGGTPGYSPFPMQAGMPMPPLPTGMPGRGVR